MFRRNLQIITERLQEMSSNTPKHRHSCRKTMEAGGINKGSQSLLVAFLLVITIAFSSGCESSGTVGTDLIGNENFMESEVLPVAGKRVIHENTFSGRLIYTAIGYLEDPLYGTVASTGLIKPAIFRDQVEVISAADTLYLRLIFEPDIYGDENSVSSFEIYEVAEIWRGNQLRYNQPPLQIDRSVKLGEFTLADEDTVLIEMDAEWTMRFAEFYNSTEEQDIRDTEYRDNFPGIAIVPSEQNRKIRFLKTGRAQADEQTILTSFLINRPLDEEENGEGEDGENGDDEDNGENGDDDENGEEEADDGNRLIGLRDWGSVVSRTNVPEISNAIVLHNTETILELDLQLPVERLSSRNISNAQLFFTKKRDSETDFPAISRPDSDLLRIHLFSDFPGDIMAEIFTRDPVFFRINEEGEDVFSIDITQFVLDEIFGESPGRKLYLTSQIVNGIIYSNQFYDSTAGENLKPRIVLTFLN